MVRCKSPIWVGHFKSKVNTIKYWGSKYDKKIIKDIEITLMDKHLSKISTKLN